MSQENKGTRTLPAAGAIGKYERLVINGSGQWAQASATQKALAVATRDTLAAGDPLPGLLLFAGGTVKMKANVAIGVGALVYSAAAGKINVTGANRLEGTAVEAATADNDIIEVVPMPVSVVSL